MAQPKVIILGGGVAAIAMAHTLKWKLGLGNFTIYEKREGPGGTWIANTYPGCGSDVPIHLYSFSFNLNPDWTQALADQKEILQYIESTVDKFQLRHHFRFGKECLGAQWKDNGWTVTFLDVSTGTKFTERCDILLSAVGGFQQPREARFPGIETFKGSVFHTAEWDHSFDYTGKRVAVIGNGCSAAQVVPSIAPHVDKVTQFARSPQWYHPRPNKVFSAWDKFCFRYVPLLQRWHRLDLFLKTDNLASVYGPDEKQVRQREAIEEEAKQYIYSQAPKKYHDFIVPDFPLGCKRRIYDPDYLATLHHSNVELLPEGIKEITETGVISEKGRQEDVDAIILATGFQVTSFLAPMEIIGKTGKSLKEQWDMHRGSQAYMGTFVHNFPNFAMLFGPNTFPAFNSVIYAIEVQVDYIANVIMKPILDGYASTIEVGADAEENFVRDLDEELSTTVFSAGCSNWYINQAGRNSAAWPGLASTFWKATLFPRWKDFVMKGGSIWWPFRWASRKLSRRSTLVALAVLGVVIESLLASSGSTPKLNEALGLLESWSAPKLRDAWALLKLKA